MGPESALTEWARLEVQRMIDMTIERYDLKQEARHRENSLKLDRNAEAVNSLRDVMAAQFQVIRTTISETTGIRRFIAWGIPVVVAILTLVAEILRATK